MHCELCGKEIRRGYLILIEGAKLIACEECAERGEIIRPVFEQEIRKESVRGEEREEVFVLVEDYGQRIRSARERRGWKIEELARRIGVKESTLRKIEEGKLPPSEDVARKLERVLNIKLYEPLEEEEELGEEEHEFTLTLVDVVRVR